MDVREFLESKLGADLSTESNVPVDCINCGKENHLYVNVTTGLFYCFVCGYGKGKRLEHLISDITGLSLHAATKKAKMLLEGDLTREYKSAEELVRVLNGDGRRRVQHVVMPIVELPSMCCSIHHKLAIRAREYLGRRGFTLQHYEPYGLLYCSPHCDRPEHGHIVFPVYDVNNNLIYYTTRAAFESDQKTFRKTINPAVPRGAALYGLREAVGASVSGTIILVEGPLDVLALPGHSVGLFGKSLNSRQAAVLRRNFQRVIIALDHDAHDSIHSVAYVLRRAGFPISSVFSYAFKTDPADAVTTDATLLIHTVHTGARPVNLNSKLSVAPF